MPYVHKFGLTKFLFKQLIVFFNVVKSWNYIEFAKLIFPKRNKILDFVRCISKKVFKLLKVPKILKEVVNHEKGPPELF